MKLKIKYLLAILVLLSSFSITAFAKPISMNNEDPINTQTLSNQKYEKKGNIVIHLDEAGKYTSVEGVEFSLYEIADVKDGSYVLNEKYENPQVNLNTITTSIELDETSNLLASYISEKAYEPNMIKKTNSEGKCDFTDLDVGVYLVIATNFVNYDTITPFIVAIPTFSEESLEMSYNIDVYPKHAPTLISVQILKFDAEDHTKVLKDAAFTLYDENMNALQVTLSNDKGIAMFYDLPFGDYFVKESSAPSGYQLSDKVIEIKLDGSYTDDYLYEIEFSNERLPSHQTGDNEPVSIYAGLSLFSFAILLIVAKKKYSKE